MKKIFSKRNIILGALLLIIISVVVIGFILFSNPKYTVTFNSQGGSAVESITAKKGDIISLPNNPEKEGFKFLYWLDETGKPVSGEFKIVKNITLNANWVEEDKEVYTITFDTDGGTEIKPILIVKGDNLILPENPIKEGYIFKKWIDKSNELEISNEALIEEDITLKAIWEQEETKEDNNVKENAKNNEVKPDNKVEQPITTPTNVEVTEILLNSSDKSMVINTSETLTATIKPENATNKNVQWSSSDSSIIKVDNSGKITAVGLGTAIIRATSSNGKTAMISVTSEVKSLSLSTTTKAIHYNGTRSATLTLNIDANGYNVPDSKIIWSIPDASGQNAAASSSTSGRTATITARSNGMSGPVPVTVSIGGKQAKQTITVEPYLSIWPNSDNTTTFSSQTPGYDYFVKFSGEKVLSLGSNIDVKWEFTSNSVVANVGTNTSKKLVLHVQYVAQNGLNIKAKTAGGQVKTIVVTPVR